MQYFVICSAALLGSALTLFSGFGLGTILVPVFALFFPVDTAIALTAVVHFLNNMFKLFLVGRNADMKIVVRFGLPSVAAAVAGAYLLGLFTQQEALYSYSVAGSTYHISPVKLVIAVLIFVFALMELIPRFSRLQFDKRYLPLGGLVSGFFGGLSGNQGALRSAFLIRAGLSKERFIATGVVLACIIDISRLSVYAGRVNAATGGVDVVLIVSAVLSAFAGAFIGNKLVRKITLKFVQIVVGVMLLLFSVLLGAGII